MIMEMYFKFSQFILFSFCLLHVIAEVSNDDQREIYIVYMGELPEVRTNLIEDHNKLLMEAIGDEKMARQAKVYSYSRSLNGFAARLLPHEADRLSQNENVLSVFPSTEMDLHTTRSWDFLGMPLTVERNATAESDIIVGLLDTGIYVPSKSFSDAGYGPVPSKWKGTCQKGDNFTGCNNKVIGARYFDIHGLGEGSPADFQGHGTHTASTVAGVPVEHASLYGIAEGTARGGVPQARIAIYKVCSKGCKGADILAGFDAAIADGVDIISVSLGGNFPIEYLNDPIAIGSFHAVKKGIFVSAAAGNSGPSFSTVNNLAPWMLTVAASTIDRVINTPVELGNGEKFNGTAINLKDTETMQPLTMGDMDICELESDEEKKVQGKIVLCNGYRRCSIKKLGGSGIIDSGYFYMDTPYLTCEAATSVSEDIADKIETYYNSTKKPMAKIHQSRNERTEEAPRIASFSSRGPDIISEKILKPDLAAPGDAILAAYSELTTLGNLISGESNDTRRVEYVILSGTSMACPHAASAIAYIKSFHPDWSPAALKSALMTTAKPMQKEQKGAELASGSGNINPVGAVDPGLVYDMDTDYYISFLCQNGYNDTQVAGMTGNKSIKCSEYQKRVGHDGLNYPSMHYQLKNPNDTDISAVFYRTVTYVGEGLSVYKAMVASPKGLSIDVEPDTLYFLEKGQKASFKVMLKGKFLKEEQWYLSGSITWSDSEHFVKSPVLVYRPQDSWA